MGGIPFDKLEVEELVNFRNLASPCEGEGDRLRWRGRKTYGNIRKIDLSVSLRSTAPLIEGEPSGCVTHLQLQI